MSLSRSKVNMRTHWKRSASVDPRKDALYRGDELSSPIGRPSDYEFGHYRGD